MLPTPHRARRTVRHALSLILLVSLTLAAPALVRAQDDAGAMALSTTSESALMHFRLGIVEVQNLGGSRAAPHFEAAIAADPDFGLAHFMHAFTDASIAFADLPAELAEAMAHMGNASTQELLFATALRALVVGDGPLGSHTLAALAEQVPGDDMVAMYAAQTAGMRGDQTDVIARWRNLLADHPDIAAVYNGLAYAQWARGDAAGAMESVATYLEMLPSHPNPHDSYAELSQWAGDYPMAWAHYGHAIEADPAIPAGHLGKAELLQLVGASEGARETLTQALASVPATGHANLMRAIGNSYLLDGMEAEAMEQLAAAAQAAEDGEQTNAATTAHLHAALAAGHFGDGAAVTAHLARAADLRDPSRPQHLAAAAVAYGMAGEEAQAMAMADALDEASSNRFFTSQAHTARALAHLSAGNAEAAMEELRQANPGNLMVKQLMAEGFAAMGRSAAAATKRDEVRNDRRMNLLNSSTPYARARAAAME